MARKASVLIVDDEENLCRFLGKEFARKGYPAREAHDRRGAFEAISRERVDVVLLDIVLGGESGLDVLRELRRDHPGIQVLVLTGNANVETAIESMKLGAYDYLSKPYSVEELCLLVDRACDAARMQRNNEAMRRDLSRQLGAKEIVGGDPKVLELVEAVRKVAPSGSPVLVTGETGTGKELVARLVHAASLVSDGPFVALNCAAFQETLLESELFGHEKGAFTGAESQKLGLIELADNGTLFLDEIGAMTMSVQAKLLRFLDSGEYRRVGGTRSLRTAARIVSATNQDLPGAIEAKRFREDLFYRLNVVTFRVPPLRERKGDIPLLVEHFLGRASLRRSGRRVEIGQRALDMMLSYDWPGNIRELQNVVERAAVMTSGESISPEDVCLPAVAPCGQLSPATGSLAEVAKAHILRVLAAAHGNKTKAAGILGIDVKTLYNKLKDYQIPL